MDILRLQENGYLLLGYSNFEAYEHNPKLALGHAEKIRASIVIYGSKDAGTVTGSIPFTTPTVSTVTSNTRGTVNGYASGVVGGTSVYGKYSGTTKSSTTTNVYGSKTTYIPYSYQVNKVFAAYLAKMKKPVFGANFYDTNSETAREIGQNGGIQLSLIVRNSPAFKADFFVNDIIIGLNKHKLNGTEDFVNLLGQSRGQVVRVELIRGGKVLIKNILLGE
ncbi:MAG: PDZ domain-containing protein [Emcibacter sp.]|nr:PDZ domain-containing protein [Emcibacter sp.]